MQVDLIVTHDGWELYCEPKDSREFVHKYWTRERPRIKKEYPDKEYTFARFRIIDMSEEDFKKLPPEKLATEYFKDKEMS